MSQPFSAAHFKKSEDHCSLKKIVINNKNKIVEVFINNYYFYASSTEKYIFHYHLNLNDHRNLHQRLIINNFNVIYLMFSLLYKQIRFRDV